MLEKLTISWNTKIRKIHRDRTNPSFSPLPVLWFLCWIALVTITPRAPPLDFGGCWVSTLGKISSLPLNPSLFMIFIIPYFNGKQKIWSVIWFSFVGYWLLHPTPFVFFLPQSNSLVFSLSVEAAKELLKEEKKETKIPFKFQLYFGV